MPRRANAAPLGFKDNRLVLAAAEKLRVPLASLIYNRFVTLLARGGESLDWSAFSQLAAEDAGMPSLGTMAKGAAGSSTP